MDIFTENFTESHKSDGFSSSEEGSSSNRRLSHTHEEGVILASSRPKKRAGRRIFKETRHPVYRGVRLRNKNKWVCELRVPNNKCRIWLGTYPTAEMAARAHDVAALALRGKSACLNFADSAWRLPSPVSNDHNEIRRVAAEAAELYGNDTHQHGSLNSKASDYEVCGSSIGVMEDVKPMHEERLYVPTAAAQSEDLHHWFSSMAEEPLRSPPPIGGYWSDWNDVEFDAEVSLWSFSI